MKEIHFRRTYLNMEQPVSYPLEGLLKSCLIKYLIYCVSLSMSIQIGPKQPTSSVVSKF